MSACDPCCSDVAIIDFETSGLTPKNSRVIEVGVALVKNGRVTERFGQLMDPGIYIPAHITQLTGIDDEMLEGAPSPEEVMPRLKEVLGERVVLAHNASFDEKFLKAEMKRVDIEFKNPVLCTLKLSRRLIDDSENHRLETLVKHLQIPVKRAHRALDDAVMTAGVWNHLYEKVVDWTGILKPTYSVFETICRQPKNRAQKIIEKIRFDHESSQESML